MNSHHRFAYRPGTYQLTSFPAAALLLRVALPFFVRNLARYPCRRFCTFRLGENVSLRRRLPSKVGVEEKDRVCDSIEDGACVRRAVKGVEERRSCERVEVNCDGENGTGDVQRGCGRVARVRIVVKVLFGVSGMKWWSGRGGRTSDWPARVCARACYRRCILSRGRRFGTSWAGVECKDWFESLRARTGWSHFRYGGTLLSLGNWRLR